MDVKPVPDCTEETEYLPIRTLGKGAFGEAVLYRKVADNSLVVWKEVLLSQLRERERKYAQNEVDILSTLNHANIISYYNHFLDGDTLLIEMEYANGGTLYDKIMTQKELLQEDTVLWYMYQTVSAVAHIHEYYILHRDIKPQNVFLTKSNLVKLGDFGISRTLDSQSQMANTCVGTPYCMSPEVIKGEPYSYKSDIWALGCLLYELLSLTRAFDATNRLKLACQIVQNDFEEISPVYSKALRDLSASLLKKDPDQRPSADDILKNNVFSDKARQFDDQVWQLNSTSRLARMTTTTVEVVPLVTSLTSEVFCWGGGRHSPHKIEVFTKGRSALRVSVGSGHAAVVTVEKEVYTWMAGSGQMGKLSGQLGHGDLAAYKAPRKVEYFHQQAVQQVSCGEDFTMFITDEGQLYSCGSDYYGCLGIDNQAGDVVHTPVLLEFFVDKPMQQVSCGANHVVALCQSGQLYTWGCGEYGRLGLDSEDDYALPQEVSIRGRHTIKQVLAGLDCTFLVKTNGRVLACGNNEHNKLGLNSSVHGLRIKEQVSYDIPCQLTFSPVKALSKYHIVEIATGKDHSVAIDMYGQCMAFGCNDWGQLGLGDCRAHDGINKVQGPLVGLRVIKVACGESFTVCATTDNHIFSWGLADQGRLGVKSDQRCCPRPRPIFGSLHKVSEIACCYWNTILVAEKVLHQKTIRSNSNSRNYDCQLSSPVSELSTTPEVSESSSSSINDEQRKESNTTKDGTVPAWLQAEMDEAEFIPAVHLIDPDLPQNSVNSSQCPAWAPFQLPQVSPSLSDAQQSFSQLNGSEWQSCDLCRPIVKQISMHLQQLSAEKLKLQEVVSQQADLIRSQAETISQLQDKLLLQQTIQANIWAALDQWQDECQTAMKCAGPVNPNSYVNDPLLTNHSICQSVRRDLSASNGATVYGQAQTDDSLASQAESPLQQCEALTSETVPSTKTLEPNSMADNGSLGNNCVTHSSICVPQQMNVQYELSAHSAKVTQGQEQRSNCLSTAICKPQAGAPRRPTEAKCNQIQRGKQYKSGFSTSTVNITKTTEELL